MTKILETACHLIAEKGVDGLEMDEVAALAGVPSKAVTSAFASKNALVAEAFEFADHRATAFMRQRLTEEGARERLEQILTVTIDDAPENNEDWALWIRIEEAAKKDDELAQVLDRQSSAWVNTITSMIELAQNQGSVSPAIDAEKTAIQLMMMQDSLGKDWVAGLLSPEKVRLLIGEEISRELGEG